MINGIAAKVIVLGLTLAISITFGSFANAAKRVALVIGNSDYKNAAPLKNPKNDAVDMSEKLTELGFKVIGGFDLSKEEMQKKVRKFSRELSGAEISLFFYAGHAMQVNGNNYLAPIDTELKFEEDLDFETVPMSLIQRQMERSTKTALIFLDACRDNPLTRSMFSKSRSGGKQGLARSAETAEGTLIAFSTQPENVALDGTGRNSPFTKALLENIGRPNVEIASLMTDVRQQVHADTSKQQTPWLNSSLLGRFYFVGNGENDAQKVASLDSTPAAPQPVVPTANQDQITTMTMQKMAWDSIQNSNDPDMYEAFIKKYEGSFFADLAASKLQKLKDAKDTPKETVVANLETNTKGEQPQNVPATPEKQVILNSGRSINEAEAISERDVAYNIQVSLKNVGCSPGRPDGKWGRNSNRALDSFARYSSLGLVSYRPSIELMNQIKKFEISSRNNGRICPKPVVVKRRKPRRNNRNNSGINLNGVAGAIIGGVIACKALRKC